jgi:hypothetical protein
VGFFNFMNSSYCFFPAERPRFERMVHKVFRMKPWIPTTKPCAWSGENCMASKCCADTQRCNWNFQKCDWFTCYSKDANYAGCVTGKPPFDWNGTRLGGFAPWEVPPAAPETLIQGMSLFCFTVVMWHNAPTEGFWDSEAALALNQKDQRKGIFQCDDHAFFEGRPLNGGGDGSIRNIDSFIYVWDVVRKDGRYAEYDWTIKVDADAVFFPDRLKLHLDAFLLDPYPC